MNAKERLLQYLSEKKLGQKKFEEMAGVSNGYINNCKGSIGTGILSKIGNAFPDLNTDWVVTGEGEMLKNRVSEDLKEEIKEIGCSIPMIPFEAIAGYSMIDNNGVDLKKCEQYSIPDFNVNGAEYVIRVSGNSMYPKYSNGDVLACKKVYDILFFQWGKVYVIDSSQGVMVKRIFEDKENKEYIKLSSDNKEHYPEFSIPKSDIRGLSIVVGLIRTE